MKLTSITLVAALIFVSPGVGCYQAAAGAFVTTPGRAVSVVPTGPAGAAPLHFSPSAMPTLAAPSFMALPGAQTLLPTVAPTVRVNAAAVQAVAAPVVSVAAAARAAAASPIKEAVAALTPSAQAAAQTPAGTPSFKTMLANPRSVALPSGEINAMPAGSAKGAGVGMMDAILGIRTVGANSAEPVPAGTSLGSIRTGLSPSRAAASLGAPVAVINAAADPLKSRPDTQKASRDLSMTEFGVINAVGIAAAVGAGFLLHSFWIGLLGTYVAAIPLIYAYVGIRRALGERINAPGVRFSPGVSWAGKSYSFRSPTPTVNAVAEAAPQGSGSKVFGFIKSVAAMGAAGAAVYGLNIAAAAFLPAIFGMTPLAAVWAVSSGALLLPIALFSRYRLGLRDSARLKGVKLALDVATGIFLGAVAVAAPAVLTGTILTAPAAGLALLGGAAFAVASRSQAQGGGVTGGIIGTIMSWGALNLIAPLFGHAAVLPLALGGVFGLIALPAMTTISFFLGRLIASAESGRPFSIPGSMQAIRFPAYTWVMTGVVFALLTGFTPVWTNAAFAAWMFLGNTRIFNYLFAGAAVWAAFTGFGAPISFLVIAFAPERAAAGMEWLLGKMLPKGEAAPSTKAKPIQIKEAAEPRWPALHMWLKTGLAIASLAVLGGVMSATVFGVHALLVNFAVAGAFSLIPLIFAKKIIKAVMKAEPMDERADPEVYGIMRDLRERINASRAAKGAKPIPMPEMVNVPMPVPNAFATGISPFKAMVGVTNEMKDMTLNPERTRAAMIRLMYISDANSKAFKVYRRAIAGSIKGVSNTSGPLEIVQVLQKADRAEIKALGVRALRGVMGHEFNHVMHRDMILGSISGTISSAISFASYGVLWAVGHAQALFARAWEKLTGKAKASSAKRPGDFRGPRAGVNPESAVQPVKPEAFEPVTTVAAAKGLWTLVKVFAALWGPVIATILAMAASRTREGHADEGGAILTEDPESLALGLGMLISWQPPAGFTIRKELLPIIASQAHVMTVSPIEQLRGAGLLPGFDRVTSALVGPADDFFFNLFITHPDTMLRIERLYEMAEAHAAGRAPKY